MINSRGARTVFSHKIWFPPQMFGSFRRGAGGILRLRVEAIKMTPQTFWLQVRAFEKKPCQTCIAIQFEYSIKTGLIEPRYVFLEMGELWGYEWTGPTITFQRAPAQSSHSNSPPEQWRKMDRKVYPVVNCALIVRLEVNAIARSRLKVDTCVSFFLNTQEVSLYYIKKIEFFMLQETPFLANEGI